MKWSPQPKEPCNRPDCDKPMRNWGYCTNHANLWRRNGTPYRQDELAEMNDSNRHERDMTAALDADPPVIVWTSRSGIQHGVVIHDPHADHPNQRKTA